MFLRHAKVLIILHSITLPGRLTSSEVLDIGGVGDFRQALKSVSSCTKASASKQPSPARKTTLLGVLNETVSYGWILINNLKK